MVTTGDIQALIQPTTLAIRLILFLLNSQYPEGHSSVVVLDQAIMEAIQGRCWDSAYQDPDGPAYHTLHDYISIYGANDWIVILYSDNTHFTGHVVQCTYSPDDIAKTLRGRICFLDSFKDPGTAHTERLQDFLTWASQLSPIKTHRTEWTLC